MKIRKVDIYFAFWMLSMLLFAGVGNLWFLYEHNMQVLTQTRMSFINEGPVGYFLMSLMIFTLGFFLKSFLSFQREVKSLSYSGNLSEVKMGNV